MSLLLWYPFNIDSRNNGVSISSFSLTSSQGTIQSGTTLVTNGLFGKCLHTCGSASSDLSIDTGYQFIKNGYDDTNRSFGGWFKFNESEIQTILTASSISSTYNLPTGNLLGYNYYGGISLLWKAIVDTDTKAMTGNKFLICAVVRNLNSSPYTANTSWYTISFDVWTHLFVITDFKNNLLKLYVNGTLYDLVSLPLINFNLYNRTYANFFINKKSIYGGNGPSLSIPFYTNDIRYYDHCISEKELKEISKGLIMHYPLNNEYAEATTNLLKEVYKTSDVATTIGWDATKHLNAINVNGWTNGYNSGVENPTTCYHAMWNLIDDIPTIVFLDLNSKHWWLGTVQGGISSISQGTIYTISFEARGKDGMFVTAALYYAYNGTSACYDCPSNNAGNSKVLINHEWKRYSIVYTATYDISSASLFCYGHYNTINGVSYVRNILLEINDHATPYINGGTRATEAIEYDTTGYNNNSIALLNIKVYDDSPVYKKCYKLADSTSLILLPNILAGLTISAFSFNIWFSNTLTELIRYANIIAFNYNNGFRIRLVKNTNNLLEYIINKGGGQIINYIITTDINFLDNKWHMLSGTFNNGRLIIYVDGESFYDNNIGISTITFNNLNGMFLGTAYAGTEYFIGNLSDFRLYTTALSANDIASLYSSRVAIDNKGNVHCYEINEK